jgi:cell division septal protein FtsQ
VLTSQYIGQGYFALNLNELEQEIQKSDKYIKSVSAEKIFPNKVRLLIEEYQPISYLEYKETCYIFSQEGLILEEMIEYEECFLEKGIKLISNQNIIAEGKLIFDKELSEVIKILSKFGWEISTVNFKENVLEIGDGEKVVIIEINQDYMIQASKLYLVLEKANIDGIEYKSLDLRFERPVMKLK